MGSFFQYREPIPGGYGGPPPPPPPVMPLRSAMRNTSPVTDQPDNQDVSLGKKDKKAKDKIEAELFGYEIVKGEDRFDQAYRSESKLSQTDLAEEVRQANKINGKDSTVRTYRDLTKNKKGQVDALLDSVRGEEKNSAAQWSLVHISKHKYKKQKDGKTSYLLVILRRHGKEGAEKGDKIKSGDKSGDKSAKSSKPEKEKKGGVAAGKGEFVDLNNLSAPSKSKGDKNKGEKKNKQKALESDDDLLDDIIKNVLPSPAGQYSPPPPPPASHLVYEIPEPRPIYVPPPSPHYVHNNPPPLPPFDPYRPMRPEPGPFRPSRPPSPPRRNSYRTSFTPRFSPSITAQPDSSTESTFSDGEWTDFTIPSSGSNDKRHRDRYPREQDHTRVYPRRSGDRIDDRHKDERYRNDRRRSPSPPPRDDRRRSPSPIRYNDRRGGRASPDRRDYGRDARDGGRRGSPERRDYSRDPRDGGRRSGPPSSYGSRRSDGQRNRIDDTDRRQLEEWGVAVREEMKREDMDEKKFEAFREGYRSALKSAEGRR